MLVFSNAGWQITDCTTVLDLVDPNTLELSSASTWDGTTAPHDTSCARREPETTTQTLLPPRMRTPVTTCKLERAL
jgi:hypothetical protein